MSEGRSPDMGQSGGRDMPNMRPIDPGLQVGQFVRSPETDEALDRVLAALAANGFELPYEGARGAAANRDALADALIRVTIDHEIDRRRP